MNKTFNQAIPQEKKTKRLNLITLPVSGDFLGLLIGDVISPLILDVACISSLACLRKESSFRFTEPFSFLNFFLHDFARLKSPSPISVCVGDFKSLHDVNSLLYSRSKSARFWKNERKKENN